MPSLITFVEDRSPPPRLGAFEDGIAASMSMMGNRSFVPMVLGEMHPNAAASFNGGLSMTACMESPSRPSSATAFLMSSAHTHRVVGRGAAARVLAHFDEAGQPVFAEKQISTLTNDKAAAALRERRFAKKFLAAGLSTTCGIVNIHAATHNAAEHTTCVLMEFMDAGSAARLAPLPEPVLAEITRQVITGLRTLHETLHVVHRDLKPENVLLSSHGAVKIADFGVAALLSDKDATADDQAGTILQMAPERLRGEAHGPASDIWSLGVTVAQLALGAHPFVVAGPEYAGNERFWLLAEVIKHTGTAKDCETATRGAIESALKNQSAELRDFVHRCTATEVSQRATLTELLQHPWLTCANLEALCAVLVSVCTSPSLPPNEPSPQLPPTSPFMKSCSTPLAPLRHVPPRATLRSTPFADHP